MRLVNTDDEPLLKELLTRHLFNPELTPEGFTPLNALVLLNFFLGYCKSDEQVTAATQIQYEKKVLQVNDFFVPLLDDWFIRPLYFVDSLGDDREAL